MTVVTSCNLFYKFIGQFIYGVHTTQITLLLPYFQKSSSAKENLSCCHTHRYFSGGIVTIIPIKIIRTCRRRSADAQHQYIISNLSLIGLSYKLLLVPASCR